MDPVPAGLQRQLVQAQLAGVKYAVDLDRLELRRDQLAVLGGRVLAQMPGVFGLLRPLGRQGEPVRSRDVGDGRRLREVRQQLGRALDVLDRLQEDDRVAALVEALDQGALEAQVRPPVACLRVLVGFRVGIDPEDLGGAPGEHVGAVALAAGEVGNRGTANALRRSTRRRPGGGDTSSSPPGRRAGCARR